MDTANRALLEIIDDIYRASTEPEAWQQVVDGVHALVPRAGVNLQGYQGGTPPQVLIVDQGYDPAYISEFRKTYAAVNPWIPLIPQMPVGVPHVMTESKFLPQVRKSDFQSFTTRNGWGSGVGMPIWTNPERLFFLVIECSQREAEKLNKTAAHLARQLGPHLARSFAISHRLGAAETQYRGLTTFLEHTPAPIIVVDRARRIRFANCAGDELLTSSTFLQAPAVGKIVLTDTAADAALAEAIRCCTACEITRATPLLIDPASADASPTIMIMPLLADRTLAKGPAGSFLAAERLALLLFIYRGGLAGDVEALFRQAFGLTPAEAQLAAALSEGAALAEYASRRRVSLATVRNQLQAIFSKTYTHRQAELVALLHNLTRGSPVRTSPKRPADS